MTSDEIEFLSIEDGMYDNELRLRMYVSVDVLGYKSPLMEAVLKLTTWDLILQAPKDFFKHEELQLLSVLPGQGVIVNQELLARWLDIYMYVVERADARWVKLTVEGYMTAFAATEERDYFIRALEVGRPMKAMFKEKAEAFYVIGSKMIHDYPHPFWQDRVLKVLNSFGTPERCRADFGKFLSEQLQDLQKDRKFQEVRKTLKCLRTLSLVSEDQYKIRCAEAYLAEGDSHQAKDPAGVYIGLADIYEKGYRKLHSVAGCEDLRTVLVNRLQHHQQERSKILGGYGVNLFPRIDYEQLRLRWVFSGVTDFNNAFQALLDLTFIAVQEINDLVEEEKQQKYYFNKMTSSVLLNGKGAAVGFLSGDQAIAHRIRMRLRECKLADIQVLKCVMDIDGIRDVDSVARLMPEGSPFLPEERNRIFFKGLYAGFEHDFQSAAYILVPQFEYIFKHIASNNEIIITRYHEKQQFDNTMGGCLEKIAPILTEDVFIELQSFLTDTNQSNFRNELVHGITAPGMVQHFGKYVWWLALKMVFRPQELLSNMDEVDLPNGSDNDLSI